MSTLQNRSLLNQSQNKTCARRSEYGFTLIETMIVIGVIALLASVALPNFTELIKNNRLVTKSNDLVTGISTARQYAIARSLTVFVCHTSSANSAIPTCGGGGSSWNSGYLIYSAPRNTLPPAALRDYASSTDDILRQAQLKSDDNISVTSTGATNHLAFSSSGLLFISGTIVMQVCDDRTAEIGRQINISTAGRINTQELQCT